MSDSVTRSLLVVAGSILATLPLAVSAQQAASGYLSPLAGWKFGGSVNTREGELNLAAAWNYSMELEFRLRSDGTGVLSVDYQPTTLRLKTIGVGSPLQNLDTHQPDRGQRNGDENRFHSDGSRWNGSTAAPQRRRRANPTAARPLRPRAIRVTSL